MGENGSPSQARRSALPLVHPQHDRSLLSRLMRLSLRLIFFTFTITVGVTRVPSLNDPYLEFGQLFWPDSWYRYISLSTSHFELIVSWSLNSTPTTRNSTWAFPAHKLWLSPSAEFSESLLWVTTLSRYKTHASDYNEFNTQVVTVLVSQFTPNPDTWEFRLAQSLKESSRIRIMLVLWSSSRESYATYRVASRWAKSRLSSNPCYLSSGGLQALASGLKKTFLFYIAKPVYGLLYSKNQEPLISPWVIPRPKCCDSYLPKTRSSLPNFTLFSSFILRS